MDVFACHQRKSLSFFFFGNLCNMYVVYRVMLVCINNEIVLVLSLFGGVEDCCEQLLC